MPIIPCPRELMGQAEALVHSVFPRMSVVERLSFLVIKQPKSIVGRLLMLIAGVRDIDAFDVYVDDAGRVLGTTGLYRYTKDSDQASWVAWFCVDPEARGRGVGQALLEHTVERARRAGFRLIRLYTSTDPNESAAQRLYERNGFTEIRRKQGIFSTLIFREKAL